MKVPGFFFYIQCGCSVILSFIKFMPVTNIIQSEYSIYDWLWRFTIMSTRQRLWILLVAIETRHPRNYEGKVVKLWLLYILLGIVKNMATNNYFVFIRDTLKIPERILQWPVHVYVRRKLSSYSLYRIGQWGMIYIEHSNITYSPTG